MAGQRRRPSNATGDRRLEDIARTAGSAWPHAAAVAAASLVVLVPLKVLRVAHGNVSTALAVSQSADKSVVLAGSLVLLTPLLLAGAVLVTAYLAARCLRSVRAAGVAGGGTLSGHTKMATRHLLWLTAPLAVQLWLLAAVCPWPSACFTVLLAALIALVTILRPIRATAPGPGHRWLLRLSPARLAAGAFGTLLLTGLLAVDPVLSPLLEDTVWLPPHRLEVQGSTVVGYVLEQDDRQIILLAEDTRVVLQLPRADVTSDVLCDLQPVDSRSAWDLLRTRPLGRLQPCTL